MGRKVVSNFSHPELVALRKCAAVGGIIIGEDIIATLSLLRVGLSQLKVPTLTKVI